MILWRQARAFSSTLVLLAFIGAWAGHTLEYLRVWGPAGVRSELVGSTHLYMLPLAAALASLAALSGLRWWRAWLALGRRIEAARDGLARAFRGDRRVALPRSPAREPAPAAALLALWLLLAALQTGTYLVQENLEALASGGHQPFLHAVTGVHWMAPLLHLGVALVLAVPTALCLRRARRRSRRIARIESLVRHLLAALRRPAATGAGRRGVSPGLRIARGLCTRAPPAAPATAS